MLRLYLLQNLYDLSDEATAAEAIRVQTAIPLAVFAIC